MTVTDGAFLKSSHSSLLSAVCDAVPGIALDCNCSSLFSLSIFMLFSCLKNLCECALISQLTLLLDKRNSLLEHRMMTRVMAPEVLDVPADSHRVIDL